MGKVNLLVKYSLINKKNEYNIKGIFDHEKIKYKDLSDIVILDLKNNSLEKIKEFEIITLNFNDKVCIIYDKSINQKLRIKIDLIELKKLDNYFYVKYKIEKDVFLIEIKII